MTNPKRIQRKRTKGWRMPDNAVYVGRPTLFGNPFKANKYEYPEIAVNKYREWLLPKDKWISLDALRVHAHLDELRGKDLACYCPLDQACHADVLLEILYDDGHK